MYMSQNSETTFSERIARTWNGRWPLERILFSLAGVVILTTIVLAVTVSQWFLVPTTYVGISQLLYARFGFCTTSLLLTRFTNARPASAEAAVR